MKKICQNFAMIFIVLFSITKSYAQFNLIFTPPASGYVTICNKTTENYFTISDITLPTTGAATLKLELNINQLAMPPFPNCVDVPPVAGNYPFNVVLIGAQGCNGNVTINFNATNNSFEFNFPSGAAHCAVTFRVDLDCSLIPPNVNQLVFLNQIWSYNGTMLNPQPTAIPVHFPYFGLTSPVIVTNVGQGQNDLNIDFAYQNIGSAGANITFEFTDLYLTSGCTPLSYQPAQSGQVLQYSLNGVTFIPFSNPKTLTVGSNQTLYIRYKVDVIACINPCSNKQKVKFKWWCTNSTPTTCTECQHEYVTQFVLNPEPITYTVERVSPSYDVAMYDNPFTNTGAGCIGQSPSLDTWTFKVKNKCVNTVLNEINLKLENLITPDYELMHINMNDVGNAVMTPTACASVASITKTAIPSPTFPCVNQLSVPLKEISLHIEKLKPNGEITFTVKFYRCCTGNYASYSYLFNNPKYYNQWRISSKCTTLCASTVGPVAAIPATNNADVYAGFISGNGYGSGGDLSQGLVFTPVTNNVMALPYPAPPSASLDYLDYRIDMNSIFKSDYDKQTLGYFKNQSGVVINNMSGYMQVKLHMKNGLFVKNTNDVHFWYQPTGGLPPVSWNAIPNSFYYKAPTGGTINTVVPPTSCSEYNYYFFYKISDLTPSDFDNIINTGFLDFKMYSCCDADQPFVDYDVEFSILQDEACLVGFNATNHPPTCTGTCCWLPLSSVVKIAAVHCPGCLSPGVIERNYEMYRMTYGYEDDNNDRKVDGGNITYTPGNVPNGYNEYGLLKKERSTHGDMLEDRAVAYVPLGYNDPTEPPADRGYCYEIGAPAAPEMQGNNIILDVLQLHRTITKSDVADMNIQVKEIEFYLDDPTFTTYPCLDQVKFENAMDAHPTILHMTVGSNGLANVLERNGEEFLFTFNLVDINNWLSSGNYPTDVNFPMHINGQNYYYRERQQYRLVVRYTVCGNTYSENLFYPLEEDLKEEIQIIDRMYLIGAPLHLTTAPFYSATPDKPNTIQEMINLGIMFPTLKAAGICTTCNDALQSNFGDAFLFICEGNGGFHYIYSTDVINNTTYNNINACSTQVVLDAQTSIHRNNVNGTITDFFPYEFRPPSLLPDKWEVKIPTAFSSGYQLTSGKVAGVNTTGAFLGGLNLTPLPTGYPNMTILNTQPIVSVLLNSLQCNDGSQTTTPVLRDQEGLIRITLDFDRINCPASGDLLTFNKSDSKIRFSNNPNAGCLDNLDYNGCTPNYNPEIENMNGTPDVDWQVPFPHLSFTPTPYLTNAGANQVCWTFNVTNTDVIPHNPPYYSAAPNFYLQVPNNTGYLSSWNLEYPLGTSITPSGNGTASIFQLDPTFNISENCNNLPCEGKLCASYSPCTQPPTNFNVLMGWNCAPYTIPTSPPLCAQQIAGTLDLQNMPVNLVAEPNIIYPDEFTACDNYTMTACFKSYEQGGVLPQVVSVNNGNTAIVINSITLRNCNGTGAAGPFSGASHQITLADLTALNINPTDPQHYMSQNECICVDVDFDINCVTDATLQLPSITLDCQTYCGNPYSASAPFPVSNLSTSHPSLCTDCFTVTKTASPTDVVQDIETVTFTITVAQNNNPMGGPYTVDVTELYPCTPEFIVDAPDPFNGGSTPVTLTFNAGDPPQTIMVFGHFTSNFPAPSVCTNTATLSNGAVATADVNVLPNCSATSMFTIADPVDGIVKYTDVMNITAFQTATSYDVQGTFIIDVSTSFAGAPGNQKIFNMEPGSEIQVNPGVQLTMKYVDLQACSKMWRGISILNTGFIGGVFGAKSCNISDAEYGVYAPHLTTVSVLATTFVNCYVGIYVPPPPAQTLMNNTTVFVSNSYFYGTGTMAIPYQGQTNLLGHVPYAGIEVSRLMLDLNQPSKGLNYFSYMSNGIVGRRSNIRVANCQFLNIHPDVVYDPLTTASLNKKFNGSAIFGSGFKTNFMIDQIGFGNMNTSLFSFFDCTYGIFADNITLHSTANNMMNMSVGYHGRLIKQKKETLITSNLIDALHSGIELLQCDESDKTIVWNNDITFGSSLQGVDDVGIDVQENLGINLNSRIHFNRINFRAGATSARTGIHFNSTHTFFATQNELNMTNNDFNHDGLFTEGSRRINISCNIVNGAANYDPLGYQSAITNEMGSSPIIGCNDVFSTINGISFLGATASTSINADVKGNNFNEHYYGLRYSFTALTNPQDWKGNVWNLPALSGFQAYHEDPSVLFVFTNRVENVSLLPTSSPPLWFFQAPNPNGDDFDCPTGGSGGSNYCGQFPPDCMGCRTEMDEKIADGTIENNPYTDETRWMLKNGLYEKLLANPSLLTDPLMQAFFNDMDGSVFEQLKEVENVRGKLFETDAAFKTLVEQNYAAAEQHLTAIDLKMQEFNTAVDNGSSTAAILADVATSNTELEALADNTGTAIDNVDALRMSNKADAEFDNTLITATVLIEENEKTVNEIYLATVGSDASEFAPEQIDLLRQIAWQCPMAGGNAVFRARALLALVEGYRYYNDREICNFAGIAIRQAAENKGNVNTMLATVHPNPTSNAATLAYYLPDQAEGEFKLTTTAGQELFTVKLQGGKQAYKFSTANYVPGIYYYELSNNGNRVAYGKLVIIR